MCRKMASSAYRQDRQARVYEPHVEPLNRFVDSLRDADAGKWVPYVGTEWGGVEARVLLLFSDPGPMTNTTLGGSGFISFENDDVSADTLCQCMKAAGMADSWAVAWNSCPWFLPAQRPTAADLRAGVGVLPRYLALLPEVRSVVLGGKVAQTAWAQFTVKAPTAAKRYRTHPMVHTSGRGVTNGGRQTRGEGIRQITATLRSAAISAGCIAEYPRHISRHHCAHRIPAPPPLEEIPTTEYGGRDSSRR